MYSIFHGSFLLARMRSDPEAHKVLIPYDTLFLGSVPLLFLLRTSAMSGSAIFPAFMHGLLSRCMKISGRVFFCTYYGTVTLYIQKPLCSEHGLLGHLGRLYSSCYNFTGYGNRMFVYQ